MLAPSFDGIQVEAAHNERWNRMCVTFRWPGFVGLLPEERFQRLARVIPEGFRQSRLAGFVWLELAPNESIDAYLRLPRSEDIADREKTICARLAQLSFFESLAGSLGVNPADHCPGDFSATITLLGALGFLPSEVQDAKLVFIRHSAYCDCQVIETVQPAVRRLLAGAA